MPSRFRNLFVRGVLFAALCAAASPFPARTAFANDSRVQIVEKLALRAKQELQAGEFERAADLYLGAWQQGQSEPALVFNAARALHMGRHLDRAETVYRQFLALHGADPKLTEKARNYLAEIGVERGEERALEAARLGRANRPDESAAAYRDAHRLAPSHPEYLLRAGREARLSTAPEQADADYAAYLAVAPPGPDRTEAEREQALLHSKPAAVAPDPAPAPLPVAPTPADAWLWALALGAHVEAAGPGGAAGAGVGLEVAAGPQRHRGSGALLTGRVDQILVGNGGTIVSLGGMWRYQFDGFGLGAGAEGTFGSVTLNAPCDDSPTTWCNKTQASGRVARARLRWDTHDIGRSSIAVDVVGGVDLDAMRPQFGLAFAILWHAR